MPFIAIALLLAAAIGGGTSVASARALPGDALWSFKVNVNENVGAALATNAKAQAHFDIGILEARIKETAALAAEARLTAETKASIEENFRVHAERVEQEIATLEAKGDFEAAAEVAARYQAAVATGASTLAESKIRAGTETSAEAGAGVDLTSFIGKVRSTLDSASRISAEASAKAASDTRAANGNTASTGVDVSTQGTGAAGAAPTGARVDVKTDAEVQIGL